MRKLKNLVATSKGAALVEYGILVGLIAVLAITAVLALGTTVQEVFTTVSSTLDRGIASAQALQ
jgi:Flp pilus assembly pilin Flp